MKKDLSSKNKIAPIVLNLKNYNAPDIVEDAGRKWVKYGASDEYFDYLLERYRGSATNHALINGIYQMIVGEGLDTEDEEALELFTYDDLLKWAFDLKCLGFYIMQIILSKDRKKIASVKHTPVQNWRSGKADENGDIKSMWYSDDWSQYQSARFRPKEYPTYNKDSKEPLQIYAIKPYRAGTFYYPNVDYQGSLQYSHIEEEISNFHINNLLNGMFPGLLINFNNGDPGLEERKAMEGMINSKWSGTSNTAKIVVAFNEDKESAATVESIGGQDLDKMFDLLSKESSEKIMIGHRVISPTLFGVRTGAGLGNNADELRVASILFEETVLRLYRLLLTNSFETILKHNGNDTKLSFKSLNPFEGFLQSDSNELPNKMNIDSGASQQLSDHKHDDRPAMSKETEDEMMKQADGNFGETIDNNEWYEIDVSEVTDEQLEDKIFSENGNSR